MQIKIFTMPFNSQLGVFDDEQFNDFSKDKELSGGNGGGERPMLQGCRLRGGSWPI